MKFHEDTLNFESYRMDKILSQKRLLTKFKRAVTKNMCVQELWFSHSACWPMLDNIYMKTHENILLKKNGHDLVTKTLLPRFKGA